MIQVIDNFIDIEYQETIKQMLFCDRFPWYYIADITSAKTPESMSAPACRHMFVSESNITSDNFQTLVPMARKITESTSFTQLVQCRTFLQFPLSDSFVRRRTDDLHIDLHTRHLVLLYYVCDSDGDTIIVDRPPDVPPTQMEKCPILKQVTPKQGRAVIFDGSLYHTAQQPTSNMRCIINFDFIEKID